MKLFSVPFLLSVAGCHSLRAGDVNDVYSDGFSDAVMRQLKIMPKSMCRCPEGFTHDPSKNTCIKLVEQFPEEMCNGGEMVDGLCLTPASPALECPEGHLSVCKELDRVESPCCAKAETADKVQRCRDGAESYGEACTRVVQQPVLFDCPDGYHMEGHNKLLKAGRPRCIKQELGKVSASCSHPDTLAPDGESCLTTVTNGFQYQCPEGYECIPHYAKDVLSKYESPLCSACVKTEQESPTCGCGEGQEEADGFCFDASTFHLCQSRMGVPLKQAPPTKLHPPTKLKHIEEPPQVKCAPLERVPCTCNHPFMLSCNASQCTCTHHRIVPVQPVCNGIVDEDGNCLVQVSSRANYQCEEGFTCDPVDKTGRCKCIRISSAEPTARCASGQQEGNLCHDVVSEPKIEECPFGYTETCCDSSCSCTKTNLAPRLLRCAPGAASITGQCFFVSQPSTGCFKGNLRDERCVQEFMAPPICI